LQTWTLTPLQKVRKIAGNIFQDTNLSKKFENGTGNLIYKTILMQRANLEKTRQKINCTDGTSIGISLDNERKIHNGDVLQGDDIMVLVKQMPETVMRINLASLEPKHLVTLGHMIGNLHKPVSVQDESVSIPVKSEIEIDFIKTIFREFFDRAEFKIEEKIFEPSKFMDSHEH